MSNTNFASPEQIAKLGDGRLAVSVAGGRVPDGAFGLGLCNGVIQHYPAGKNNLQQPKNGHLWWVHPGRQALRFAPSPASPEAGIALLVEAHLPNHEPTLALGNWLAQQGCVVGLDDVAKALIGAMLGNPGLQLPPCVQAEELERISRSLSAAMMRTMGLRCGPIARIDLFPEVNCANPPSDPPPTVAPDRQGGEGAAFRAPEPPQMADIALSEVVALDARFEQRFFSELPKLANRLRAQAWPADDAAFDRQRALLKRVEHLAATSGRLPTLTPRTDPGRLSAATVRLLAAESRKAAMALDQAWSVLDGLSPTALSWPGQQEQLQGIVKALEQAIARRRGGAGAAAFRMAVDGSNAAWWEGE